MKHVAIIPARGGSQRIPRKNIKMFHGKPIIAYSIETARAAALFGNSIYVSTDDSEIAAVALSYGARVLRRDPSFAHDDIGTQEVMADAIRQLFPDGQPTEPHYSCCIYATAPLMIATDLRAGLQALQDRYCTRALFALPVETAKQCVADAGQWYWGQTWAFGQEPLIGTHTVLCPLPSRRVCDINTPEDWAEAERKYTEGFRDG